MWIARDKDGDLYLYDIKPYRYDDEMWDNKDELGGESISLNCKLFPELKWENEPIEVELTIKK